MMDLAAQKKINIEMISTSEIRIACVIGQKDLDKAVRALHRAFNLDSKRKKK